MPEDDHNIRRAITESVGFMKVGYALLCNGGACYVGCWRFAPIFLHCFVLLTLFQLNQMIIGAMRDWMVAQGADALLERRCVVTRSSACFFCCALRCLLVESVPCREELGDDHPETLHLMTHLGSLLMTQVWELEASCDRAHPDCSRSARVAYDVPDWSYVSYYFQGKPAAAEPLFAEAVITYREIQVCEIQVCSLTYREIQVCEIQVCSLAYREIQVCKSHVGAPVAARCCWRDLCL
jgi:hypothetical protein